MSVKYPYKHWILIGILLIIGTGTRFYGLKEKGLYLWDEGVFYEAGIYVHYRLHQQFPGVFSPPGNTSWQNVDGVLVPGFPTFLWKPIHVFFTFISMVLTGYKDYAGLYISVFFSTLTIISVYLLGKTLRDRTLGVVSTLMLTFSPFHLIYSRTGLQESDSSFFLVLTIIFYYLSLKEKRFSTLYIFLTGIFAGTTLGLSYRWMILPLFLAVIELVMGIKTRKKLGISLFRSWFMVIGGFLIMIFFMDLSYRFFFPEELGMYERHTYYQAIKQKLGAESHWDAKDPFYYFIQLYRVEKLVSCIMICTGFLYIILRGNLLEKGILLFSLVPLVLFGFISTRLMRVLASIIPFIHLVSAIGLLWMWKMLTDHAGKIKFIVPIILLSCYVIPSSIIQYRILKVHCSYRQAVSYIETSGDLRHISTMWPISAVYSGCSNVPKYPLNSRAELYNLYQRGFRYLLVDYQKYYFPYPEWLKDIENTMLPVKAWENDVVEILYALDENHSRIDRDRILQSDQTVHYIKLYDLKEYFSRD